jgi:SAM-dependent methyltransferase
MKKAEKKKVMKEYYDDIFGKEIRFREQWEGKIGVDYKVPKEIGYLTDFLKNKKPREMSMLELGAGDGYSSMKIIKALKPKRYVATELSDEGVKKIRSLGIEARKMDATSLKFPDDSFDVVFTFNTMHHVDDPRKMAQEMLRVTKKYFLLCEASGLSIPRKILEFTPRNRRANERSYLPSTYRSFFESRSLKWIKTKPFCFTFAFTPDPLFGVAVSLSEFLEKVPIIRWQGSSLLIYGEKS